MDNLSKNGIPDVTRSQIETILKIKKVYFILFNSFCGITFWKNARRCLLRGHQHGKNFQFCKKPHYIHQKVAQGFPYRNFVWGAGRPPPPGAPLDVGTHVGADPPPRQAGPGRRGGRPIKEGGGRGGRPFSEAISKKKKRLTKC